ncbi:MAG: hypothetical protein ACK51L_03175 [bacterium]
MLLYCATDCTPTTAEYTTLSETMREILSSSWQMEEKNVPMHPVPMSNLGSRKQDRPYQVDAHTTETQKISISTSQYGYTTESQQ